MPRFVSFAIGVVCFVIAVSLLIVWITSSPVSFGSWVTVVSLFIAAFTFFVIGFAFCIVALGD